MTPANLACSRRAASNDVSSGRPPLHRRMAAPDRLEAQLLRAA
ncbi:hypothetical protein [Baekduia soli]|nr:hypothetical protein [Baekduia soli]